MKRKKERTFVRSLFSDQLFLSQSGISSLPEEPLLSEVVVPPEVVLLLVPLLVVSLLPELLFVLVVSVCFTSGRVVER